MTRGNRFLTFGRRSIAHYFLNDLKGLCDGGPVKINGGVTVDSSPTSLLRNHVRQLGERIYLVL